MKKALKTPKPAGVIIEKKITESDNQGGLKNDRNSGNGITNKEHEIIKMDHVNKLFFISLFKINCPISSTLYNPDLINVSEFCKWFGSNF